MRLREEIIIGEGSYGNSWTLVRDLRTNPSYYVSGNSSSFLINGAFLDTRLIILKNSDEGKKLYELVYHSDHASKVMDFIDGLVLKHINLEHAREAIENQVYNAYEAGRVKQAQDIREALAYGVL